MKKVSEQDGFTLIEAMIAVFLLVIGIASLYSMQISSIDGNARANRLSYANNAANDTYERLQNVAYNNAAMNIGVHTEAELAGITLPPSVTGVTWTVGEWTSLDGIDNDGDGTTDEGDEHRIKEVNLTVNYRDETGARQMTMNFYKNEQL